jgi:hypothetical protein
MDVLTETKPVEVDAMVILPQFTRMLESDAYIAAEKELLSALEEQRRAVKALDEADSRVAAARTFIQWAMQEFIKDDCKSRLTQP